MLQPTDLQRLRALVNRHGDKKDEGAMARIVLTLFGQDTTPNPLVSETPTLANIDRLMEQAEGEEYTALVMKKAKLELQNS
jgi:hypothetical protein